jgi:hypothetical protein
MSVDAHKNFGISAVATAPTPALSGTTLNVTTGEGALFPAVPFNVVVWPAGSSPTSANAEILRVTSKGTGDDWTVTRTQESSSSRAIGLGDQVSAAITAKTLTDVEDRAVGIGVSTPCVIPGGRLTLETTVPVSTTDQTAKTTLYYTPYTHSRIELYDGTYWNRRTFGELSIAVPATTSQMYDVFVYDSGGTPTLELTAWTNDTTRATALVRQNGMWSKTGALTRLYLGSFRTTGVSGQTEDSAAKRYVWNYYNRVDRVLQAALETANSWSYTTATWRQANANTTNQLDLVCGYSEDAVSIHALASVGTSAGSANARTSIGEDSTSAPHASALYGNTTATAKTLNVATLRKIPAVGRHYYTWLEFSDAAGTTTWYGDDSGAGAQSGISGSFRA